MFLADAQNAQVRLSAVIRQTQQTIADRLAKSLDGNYKKATLIARTEVHRVREAAHSASAKELNETLKKGNSGLRYVKKWKTMKDGAVRPNVRYKTKKGWKSGKSRPGAPNHVKMHNVVVLEEEQFDLGGGVMTDAPGQSGVAGHDCNCRCQCLHLLMDDQEFFEATGRHFPEVKKGLENSANKDIIVGEPDTGGGFTALSDDIKERSAQVGVALNEYTSRPSKWSGKTTVKSKEELPNYLGVKKWNCDIELRSDSDTKTAVHEHLHARSVSYYTPSVYLQWQKAEEGAVELFSQEICKKNNIAYKEVYKSVVKQLRIANSILKEHPSEYEFAKEFYEVDLPNRYSWLKARADALIDRNVLSEKTVKALTEAVNTIIGKV